MFGREQLGVGRVRIRKLMEDRPGHADVPGRVDDERDLGEGQQRQAVVEASEGPGLLLQVGVRGQCREEHAFRYRPEGRGHRIQGAPRGQVGRSDPAPMRFGRAANSSATPPGRDLFGSCEFSLKRRLCRRRRQFAVKCRLWFPAVCGPGPQRGSPARSACDCFGQRELRPISSPASGVVRIDSRKASSLFDRVRGKQSGEDGFAPTAMISADAMKEWRTITPKRVKSAGTSERRRAMCQSLSNAWRAKAS